MGKMTSAGTKLAISAAAPATQTAAGYQALTYTEIGGIESIGAFGAVTEEVTFQPLRGARESYKGGTNFGSLSPSIAHDDDDAGQELLRTASEDATDLYSFEVTYPSGAKRFFQGRVFGYPENVGAANAMLMANPSINLSTTVIKVPAP